MLHVVQLMGPLYHLLAAEERVQAVREAQRVLKPQGTLFAAFITRFAPFRDAAANYPESVLENPTYLDHLLATGVHDHATSFTSAYFAHPDEIVPFTEGEGLRTLAMLGCEGVVAGHEEKVNALHGPAWERWVALNYRMGKDPALRGAADHLLYIGTMATATPLRAGRQHQVVGSLTRRPGCADRLPCKMPGAHAHITSGKQPNLRQREGRA